MGLMCSVALLFFPFASFLASLLRRIVRSVSGSVNVIERGTIAACHITERFLGCFFHELNRALRGKFDTGQNKNNQ